MCEVPTTAYERGLHTPWYTASLTRAAACQAQTSSRPVLLVSMAIQFYLVLIAQGKLPSSLFFTASKRGGLPLLDMLTM